MVIKKGDLEQKGLSEVEEEALKKAEDTIDSVLKMEYRGLETKKITVSTDKLPNLSQRAQKELILKYTVAGWRVTYSRGSDDQRDPISPYFTFK